MTIENRKYQEFCVQYIRQGKTNQWKAKTSKLKGIGILQSDGSKGLNTALWGNQSTDDEIHETIPVAVEHDPRDFDLSPELEEAQITMIEKANQKADKIFLERHPDARIEDS